MLFGCSIVPQQSNQTNVYADPESVVSHYDMWVQNGCTLFRRHEIKSFPGERCIFLDDGKFVSSTKKEIRMFSPGKEILWEIKGHFHHQVNLSEDKQRILALSSDIVVRDEKKVRDDVVVILNLDGKIIARERIYPHLVSERTAKVRKMIQENPLDPEVKYESSHFNSIYEIPENKYSKEIPWLQAGNIIINSTGIGVYVLTPNLKKIIHHKVFPFSFLHSIHDVQITPEGEYLIFNNKVTNSRGARISAIQKYNEPEDKLTLDFRASPQEIFYSPYCGGVQDLGDVIFFSHVFNGGYLYSKGEKTIIQSFPGVNGDERESSPTQQLKLINGHSFLKNVSN